MNALETESNADPLEDYEISDAEHEFYKREGWLLLPGVLKTSAIGPVRQDVLDVLAAFGKKAADLHRGDDVSHKLLQTSQYLTPASISKSRNHPTRTICSAFIPT